MTDAVRGAARSTWSFPSRRRASESLRAYMHGKRVGVCTVVLLMNVAVRLVLSAA